MPLDWNQKQKDFIAALEAIVEVFEKILTDNDSLGIIDNAKSKELSDLKKHGEDILNKLKSKEFTVAIVGLENSGKSSLGNALIGIPELLPTDELRCTYTVTKAVSGKQNRGEVLLYTLEEFRKKFDEMVKDVAPNFVGVADFQNITWFNIYPRDPVTNKEKDIKAIIDNRNSILALLQGNNILTFTDNKLTTSEFKQFITGKDANGIFNGYPYAVKEITIWSKNFKDMEDIVLYDVPGFDSTTELHKEQTDAMINDADAVILVVNLFDGAEIRSTQTEIFKSGKDKYQTSYKDKVFIFGNKADLIFTSQNIIEPKETAKKNRAALIKSAQDENISDERYINCGSVQSYSSGTEEFLLATNLGLKEEIQAVKVEENGKTKIITAGGVELLKLKLENYYKTVRYEVLTQRVGVILDGARSFLEEINIRCVDAELDNGGIIYYDAAENLEKFKLAANALIQNKIHVIKSERFFSKCLEKKNLDQLFPNQSTNSTILNEIEHAQPLDVYEIFHAENIEPAFRERIFQSFLNNILNVTGKNMKDTAEDIFKELKACFLANMGMPEDIRLSDRILLEKTVEELFKKLRGNRNFAEGNFSGSGADIRLLLEILIKRSLNARIATITAPDNWTRLNSLANYYKPSYESTADKKKFVTEFFMRIVTQKIFTEKRNYDAQTIIIKNNLQNFFEFKVQEKLLSDLTISELPLDDWANKLSKRGRTFHENDVLAKKFDELMTFEGSWLFKRGSDKIFLLSQTLSDYVENLPIQIEENIFDLPQEITPQWLNQISNANDIVIKNKQDMINVLNNDISNLRHFILNALISNLDMEGEFISSLTKAVDEICCWKNSEYGKEAVRLWVKRNIRTIQAKEFVRIEEEKTKNEQRKELATSVEAALNELIKQM